MAVPPPPTGEFDGFSYPPATFAAGTGTLTQLSRRLDTSRYSSACWHCWSQSCLQGKMQLWHGPVARHRFRSFDPCVVKPILTHILGCRDTSYRQESGCYILEAWNARATEPQNHGIEEPKSHQEPVLLWEKTDSHVGSIRKHTVAQEGCNKLESYHCRVQRGGLLWARPGVPDSFGASLHCLPRPFPQEARCHNCWACWVEAKLRMARTLQRTARSQTCGRRTPRDLLFCVSHHESLWTVNKAFCHVNLWGTPPPDARACVIELGAKKHMACLADMVLWYFSSFDAFWCVLCFAVSRCVHWIFFLAESRDPPRTPSTDWTRTTIQGPG